MVLPIWCKPCSDSNFNFHQKDVNGICVTGLPSPSDMLVMEEDIYCLFSKFGQVTDVFLPDNCAYCVVNYRDRHSVNDAMTMPVFLFGRKLKIKLQKVPGAGRDKYSLERLIPSYHEELLRSISRLKDHNNQVETFVKGVQPDENCIRKQTEVCRDLEKTLSCLPCSSTYKVFLFGSSVTGLAFKDSDLDVFYGKDSFNNGPVYSNVFNDVKRKLRKHKCFTSIRPIHRARVPIIKMLHEPTGYNIDLSFTHAMGVENSKMIRFFMSLDKRLKPLFMIVKYWAKLHHLTGKRMSNYALLLLLINFLQALQEPILPPFCQLRHDGLVAKKIGDWDANFDDDVTRLKPTCNDLPVEELLCLFFESMVKTDFENHVVCPFMGVLIHRGCFNNLYLPQEMQNYAHNVWAGKPHLKINSAVCLQDPIELNFNVTNNLTKDDFQCFKDHCLVAAQLGHSMPPHLFLAKLLTTVCEVELSWLHYPIHMRRLRPCMLLHVPHPNNCTDEISWRSDLLQKLILIFRKVLKIHVQIDNMQGKETKPGDSQKLLCEGSRVLWKGREKLWHKWHSKKKQVSYCLIDSNEEVQILHVMKASGSNNHGKRKRDEEEERGSRRSKTGGERGKSNVGVDIELDESVKDSQSVPRILPEEINLEETAQDTIVLRSLQDEINLTNDMVRKGHALPGNTFILKFSCIVCKSTNSKTSIEIADLKSRNNFFSSLCIFLQDFFNKHMIEAVSN